MKGISFKLLILIIIGLFIGFGIAWLYQYYKYTIQSQNHSAQIEQNFSFQSENSAIIYPFRNWAVKEGPSIQAQGALLIDIDSDYVFYQKDANVRRPIASITKLMTAAIAEENIRPDELIAISAKALNTDGDPAVFYLNEKVSTSDLIKALLMISSNKAGAALAEYKDENFFIELMNEKAKELKMTQTTFVEPTGLNFLNQSTPNDLIRLLKYLVKNHPNLLLISKTFETQINGQNPNVIHQLKNINQLTNKPNFLDDLGIVFLGGKTGFTDEAWQTFAGLFLVPSQRPNEESKRVAVVVLKTPDRYNDIKALLEWLVKAYIF